VTPDDWALMRACAVEVLAAARPWWPDANEYYRSQLANPFIVLSETMARQDARKDPTPRPPHRMGQQDLMWACYRAAEAIRINVHPYDERGAALWQAGARLAYITAGIKADVLAK